MNTDNQVDQVDHCPLQIVQNHRGASVLLLAPDSSVRHRAANSGRAHLAGRTYTGRSEVRPGWWSGGGFMLRSNKCCYRTLEGKTDIRTYPKPG